MSLASDSRLLVDVTTIELMQWKWIHESVTTKRPLIVINTAVQGSPTFLFHGRLSYYTTVREPCVFRNVNVSGYAAFYVINKFFVNILFFSFLTKCLCRPDEMAFGP